jgi:hypothetical protein
MWTLVDSDQSGAGVPEKLISHSGHLFVIYVTFLEKKRWLRMEKTTNSAVVISKTCATYPELYRAV